MPHIHTGPNEHDVTASAWIVRMDGDAPRIMLHRHLRLNVFMQFGGHIELDEHPWGSIIRELREEAGYDLDQLQVLQPKNSMTRLNDVILLPQPLCIFSATYGDQKPNHFHDDISWAFVTRESPRHVPDNRESEDIVLLDRAQLLALKRNDVWEDVVEIALFIFDTALTQWLPVPALPLTRK